MRRFGKWNRSPSHATIVAYLALFVALGGSSLAVTHGKGSSSEKGTISGRDIKKGSIPLSRLAPAAVGTLEDSCKKNIAQIGSVCIDAASPQTDWFSANYFCEQRGLRLPTYAEAFRISTTSPYRNTPVWADFTWEDQGVNAGTYKAAKAVWDGSDYTYGAHSVFGLGICVSYPTDQH